MEWGRIAGIVLGSIFILGGGAVLVFRVARSGVMTRDQQLRVRAEGASAAELLARVREAYKQIVAGVGYVAVGALMIWVSISAR